MSSTRIFMKQLMVSGSGGGRSVTVGLSGAGPPRVLTMSVACAHYFSPEHIFVELGGSLDIGYGKKVRRSDRLVERRPNSVLFQSLGTVGEQTCGRERLHGRTNTATGDLTRKGITFPRGLALRRDR